MTHPTVSEITAPAHWQRVDFLSDVHLHAAEIHTFAAWSDYLAHTPCDALFILGDLFEVWVGDDVLLDATHGPFWRACAQALHTASARLPIFYMVGNRDFLAGETLLETAGWMCLVSCGCTTRATLRCMSGPARQPIWGLLKPGGLSGRCCIHCRRIRHEDGRNGTCSFSVTHSVWG